ncbi:endonuclease I [Tamlana nanhaiensis]|uniref:Endonuclease I n=1 Tax=Neotamlana nanhaiensis TaxID=1382798 RepID=A0A0D7VYM8_9FLAO|nr:endonuclease [Tamlana nanhaiensis]KJD31884.1 endonuclease I [Tamlana nanhaiensis]
MKKILYILCLAFLIVNCSSGSDDVISEPDDTDPNQVPVAVNDVATTIEDKTVDIAILLDNDTVVDNARISSFDTTSTQGGTIEDNRDGSYGYTPPLGFVGEDTFTYTLCDRDDTPDCSTATVTITVTDEGNPEATNDAVFALYNSTKNISILLDNDNAIDDATITAVSDASSAGTVVLNTDGTVTYTAQNGFLGEDTFTYTICDDDTPEASCATATVTVTVIEAINFNIPEAIQDYYEGVIFSEDSNLTFDEVVSLTINKHTTLLSYGQRHNFLYDADEDMSNTDNVILMYSGESRYWEEYDSPNNSYRPTSFNTEHIYPQSLLTEDEAPNDMHHMRVCDQSVNSQRSNYPYRDGSGGYLLTNQEWFPGDEWKGDVARMVMYVNVRYGELFSKVGSLELFLKWNIEDPVSDFERQRNNVIYGAQGNRNPFIDNPYLATLIWGGDDAENTWE